MSLVTMNKKFLRMHADKAALDTATFRLYMTFMKILGARMVDRL